MFLNVEAFNQMCKSTYRNVKNGPGLSKVLHVPTVATRILPADLLQHP